MVTPIEPTDPVDVTKLRDLMMQWARGERSHWNEFNRIAGDPATVVAMCAVADAQEVVKLSAAIQALKGVAPTSTEPPVCHTPSCPISLFEHTEAHGECVPASAPTTLPGAVTPNPDTWFMVGSNGSVLQGSENGWVPVHTSVLEKHLTDTSSSEGCRS